MEWVARHTHMYFIKNTIVANSAKTHMTFNNVLIGGGRRS